MAVNPVSITSVSNSSIDLAAGQPVAFAFDLANVTFERQSHDLVLSENGSTLVLKNFFVENGEGHGIRPLILADGTEIDAAAFLQKIDSDFDLSTAAGPGGASAADSSGVGEYASDAGNLIDGVARLGDLGTDYWGRETEVPEVYSGLEALSGGALSAEASFPSTPGITDPGTPTPPVVVPPASISLLPPDGRLVMYFDAGMEAGMNATNNAQPVAAMAGTGTALRNGYGVCSYDAEGKLVFELNDAGKAALAEAAAQGRDTVFEYVTFQTGSNPDTFHSVEIVLTVNPAFGSLTGHDNNVSERDPFIDLSNDRYQDDPENGPWDTSYWNHLDYETHDNQNVSATTDRIHIEGHSQNLPCNMVGDGPWDGDGSGQLWQGNDYFEIKHGGMIDLLETRAGDDTIIVHGSTNNSRIHAGLGQDTIVLNGTLHNSKLTMSTNDVASETEKPGYWSYLDANGDFIETKYDVTLEGSVYGFHNTLHITGDVRTTANKDTFAGEDTIAYTEILGSAAHDYIRIDGSVTGTATDMTVISTREGNDYVQIGGDVAHTGIYLAADVNDLSARPVDNRYTEDGGDFGNVLHIGGNVSHSVIGGSIGNDLVTAGDIQETAIRLGAGDDTLKAGSLGAGVIVETGDGNDTVILSGITEPGAVLDGGVGRDTLVLAMGGSGSNQTGAGGDFAGLVGHHTVISGFEEIVIDLSGGGTDTLTNLDAMLENFLGGKNVGDSLTITIKGDAEDSVDLAGFATSSQWTQSMENGMVTYTNNDNQDIKILIESGMLS